MLRPARWCCGLSASFSLRCASISRNLVFFGYYRKRALQAKYLIKQTSNLEITYYLTSEAKSAFYPSINLSGDFGWPGLVNGVLSLVQPLFSQGSLKCRLNVSRMDEEIAQLLSAQLGEAESRYGMREATIMLYKSLGR